MSNNARKRTSDGGSAGLGQHCRLIRFWAENLMDRSLAHSPPGTAERKQYNHQLIRRGKMKKMQCQLSLNNVHWPSRKTPLKVGLVR
jgi:hypothetical protein